MDNAWKNPNPHKSYYWVQIWSHWKEGGIMIIVGGEPLPVKIVILPRKKSKYVHSSFSNKMNQNNKLWVHFKIYVVIDRIWVLQFLFSQEILLLRKWKPFKFVSLFNGFYKIIQIVSFKFHRFQKIYLQLIWNHMDKCRSILSNIN